MSRDHGPGSPDRPALGRTGTDVTIHPLARLLHGESISLGSNIIIDDFVFVGRHEQLLIGNHVHIASHASITGGGWCVLGDFSGISSGARILSGSDDLVDGRLTGPTVPGQFRSVTRDRIAVGRHVVIGANAVVLPGVTIGEGAIVGAGSVVTGNLDPWSVNVGQPARPVGERDRVSVLDAERTLEATHGLLTNTLRGVPEELAR